MIQPIIFLLFINMTALIPLDAVEVSIWNQPSLSGKYYVDVDTTLNIPLLGKFSVRNIPVDSLKNLLIARIQNYYGEIYLNINFYYRINVFGEVKIPGSYYLKSGDNLTNLLAQAGGPTDRGTLSKIRILSLGKERRINFEKILKSGRHAEELNLQPGDVVIVPRRFLPAIQEWSALFTLGTFILQSLQLYYTYTR